MKTQGFPFKCPACGVTGTYKAVTMAVAQEYKCPHDGRVMLWQTPINHVPGGTISVGGYVHKDIDYVPELPAHILDKLESIGRR